MVGRLEKLGLEASEKRIQSEYGGFSLKATAAASRPSSHFVAFSSAHLSFVHDSTRRSATGREDDLEGERISNFESTSPRVINRKPRKLLFAPVFAFGGDGISNAQSRLLLLPFLLLQFLFGAHGRA